MAEFKFYFDKQPIYSYEQVCAAIDSCLFTTRTESLHTLFHELEAFTRDHAYNYEETPATKHYQHYLGYTLTFLMPRTIVKTQYTHLIEKLTSQVLDKRNLPCFGYIKRQGNARYLVLVIGQRGYYDQEKEIKVLRTNTSYRNAATKRICSKEDPQAEVYYQEGDVKSSFMSHWSKKKRLFEMPRTEFKLFCVKMEQVWHQVLVQLNVVDRTMNFFRGIKQFKYERNGKRMIYVNMNINTYNNIIYEMNTEYNKLYDILYSPAKFYQEESIMVAFQQLKHKYHQRLRNKRFSPNKSITLPITPYFRRDYFMENMETFLDMFINDCKEFVQKYIYMDIMSM